MAVTSVNDIAAGLASSQDVRTLKNITALKSNGAFESSWLAPGYPAAGGTAPIYTTGSGYTCSGATTGALPYTNASVVNYIAKVSASSTIAGILYVYDRLWACSGMGFAAGTYTVTTPGTLPARVSDSGASAEIWIEQNVAAGAASGSLTVNYLNSSGSARVGSIAAVVSAPVVGQMQPVPQQGPGRGVSQITSVINSATWTSGSWGVTICKYVAAIPIPLAGQGVALDWAQVGLPTLVNDMCLFYVWQGGTTTAPVVMCQIEVIDK
jgi:hypothetical protein